MPLPGALTLTVLTGTYTAPDGTPLGGQLTFTPSSALTNESGHPVLAATPLTVRLQPGTGAFSIDLLNTDNAGLLPDTWMWHVIVAVPGAQETYFFGLPSTLGPSTDINALTPASPPPAGVTFVASVNGQTGDVVLADGFGILPPAGDLGAGTTLAPQVTATHLAAPLPVVQGGTGAASGSGALTALGAASSAALAAEVSRAEAAEAGFASSSALTSETSRATTAEALLAPKASPALTGSPTAPTQTTGDTSTKIATDAFVGTAVTTETTRATTAEGLAAQKSANLSDLASAVTARGNIGAQGARTPTSVKTGTSYTAAAGDYAKIDSTAGAYTLTLPTAPADKTVLGVKLVASATPLNAVTVTCGGTDKFNLPGGGTTLVLKLLNQGCQLQYNSSAGVWDVHGDDLPLGGLDARYGQLATASTYAADQYFKSGRPWFDVIAFGADPTGVADSTAAFTAAILAATGSATPATSTRTAKGPVWMPSGTYKITSDLLIQSVSGFALLGAGANSTTIRASGAGFTQAAVFIDGSLDGVFAGFQVAGDGTEGTAASGSGGGIPDGIRLDWTTGAARSTSANTFRNIRVRNLLFTVGLSLEGNSTRQVDGTTLHDVVVTGQQVAGSWSGTGNWQKGIALGNGSFGNNYDHVICNSSASSCFTGLYCSASGFELYGSQPAGNSTDFFLSPGSQISVAGVQSQNSGQLVSGSGGSAVVLVSVRDVLFKTNNLVSTGKWVQTAGGGASWLFENVQCVTNSTGGVGGLGVPVMAFSGSGAKENITLVNVMQMAPPSTGVTVTAAGSLLAVNYVQTNSSGQVAALFPVWMANGSVAVASGLTGATAASRWAGATASGAPVTGTFAVGDFVLDQTGAIWVCTTAGSPGTWTQVGGTPKAPDIQIFTSSGTWTKPSGPVPITTEVLLIAPGGGGGSGRQGAVSTVRCGGAGGAGGQVLRTIFKTADLTSTVSVTVPGQQNGGAAQASADSDGNTGTGFVNTSFGTFCRAEGGGGGGGGMVAVAAGGLMFLGLTAVNGNGASSVTTTTTVAAKTAGLTGPGGPAGGSITAANAVGNGAAGSASGFGALTPVGAAGVVDTTAPTAGAGTTINGSVGTSSGSGAASITTAAQAGADAAATSYGAGGSGGGASLDGNSSGAGGKGGPGFAMVISYFQ